MGSVGGVNDLVYIKSENKKDRNAQTEKPVEKIKSIIIIIFVRIFLLQKSGIGDRFNFQLTDKNVLLKIDISKQGCVVDFCVEEVYA